MDKAKAISALETVKYLAQYPGLLEDFAVNQLPVLRQADPNFGVEILSKQAELADAEREALIQTAAELIESPQEAQLFQAGMNVLQKYAEANPEWLRYFDLLVDAVDRATNTLAKVAQAEAAAAPSVAQAVTEVEDTNPAPGTVPAPTPEELAAIQPTTEAPAAVEAVAAPEAEEAEVVAQVEEAADAEEAAASPTTDDQEALIDDAAAALADEYDDMFEDIRDRLHTIMKDFASAIALALAHSLANLAAAGLPPEEFVDAATELVEAALDDVFEGEDVDQVIESGQ